MKISHKIIITALVLIGIAIASPMVMAAYYVDPYALALSAAIGGLGIIEQTGMLSKECRVYLTNRGFPEPLLEEMQKPVNQATWDELQIMRKEAVKIRSKILTDQCVSAEKREKIVSEDAIAEAEAIADGIVMRCTREMNLRDESGERGPRNLKSGRVVTSGGHDHEQGDGFKDLRTGKFVRVLRYDQRIAAPRFGERKIGLDVGHIAYRAVTGHWQNEEIANEARAMSVGSDAGGGYFVPSPISAEVIDLARAQSVVMQAGVRTIPMDSSTLDLARIESDPTFTWKAENAAGTPGDLTIGRVQLNAKTVMAIIPLSGELWQDAPNINEVLRGVISRGLAAEIDRVVLHGSGTGAEPGGIYGHATVQTSTLGTAPANYDFISTGAQLVYTANHVPNALVMHPRTYGQLERLKEATTLAPLAPPKFFTDLQRFRTTNVRINLENAGSPTEHTDVSTAFIGKWDEAVLGIRSELQIMASREGSDGTNNAAREFKILLIAVARFDVQLLRPAAFHTTLDIRSA